MANNPVIDLQPVLQVKHWLGQFDATLSQLNNGLVCSNQAANPIEQLANYLDNAIQYGFDPIAAQSRTQALTLLAFEQGYTQEEVEALLNVKPQPNGNPLRV
ncbi:MAG: hypothetical protein JXK16_04745 [Thiotrichales bacterium]|nr:hypothetical protein [Thiotrichales bacterium]